MNIRHAYSKEDPSPDERLLWGALVDDVDALALLRIGYQAGQEAEAQYSESDVEEAEERGFDVGHDRGWAAGFEAGALAADEDAA